jgi:hypothetical protein
MLSRILLQFEDSEVRSKYSFEKQKFYQKAIPIITVMLIALSLTIEIVYRVMNLGEDDISLLTSCINWVSCGAFIVLSFVIRQATWTCYFVSPILSYLSYYYFGFIDYDNTQEILYYR